MNISFCIRLRFDCICSFYILHFNLPLYIYSVDATFCGKRTLQHQCQTVDAQMRSVNEASNEVCV